MGEFPRSRLHPSVWKCSGKCRVHERHHFVWGIFSFVMKNVGAFVLFFSFFSFFQRSCHSPRENRNWKNKTTKKVGQNLSQEKPSLQSPHAVVTCRCQASQSALGKAFDT